MKHWPLWMRTRLGAWLATHFRLWAVLWRREVLLADYREAEELEQQARHLLLLELVDGPERLTLQTWIRWANARLAVDRAFERMDERWGR